MTVITKCDRKLFQNVTGITKCDRKLLKSVIGITKSDKKLLRSVTAITRCGNYYKMIIMNDELFFWYGCEMRLALFPAGKIVIDPHHRNLWRAVSWTWTCAELEFSFVDWSCAVVITITPQRHVRWDVLIIVAFVN